MSEGSVIKRGGGILCYTINNEGSVMFLMQSMGGESRKKGHLVDLGGGCNNSDESCENAAIREAFEEGLRFVYPTMIEWRAVFYSSQPFSLRRRKKNKEWWLYLVRVQYFDLSALNSSIDRTTKSRNYHWISAQDLLLACKKTKKEPDVVPHVPDGAIPQRVWRRLAQMPLRKAVKILVKIGVLQAKVARLE